MYLALSSDDRGRLVAGSQEGMLVSLTRQKGGCASQVGELLSVLCLLLVAAKLWGLSGAHSEA